MGKSKKQTNAAARNGQSPSTDSSLADFLFEAGLLKTVGRTGWDTVRAPRESVAEHSFRTALVGWTLSRMAILSAAEEAAVIKTCLFHDLHESRVGDLHRLAKMYGKLDEKKAEKDQRAGLPKEMQEDLAAALDQLPPRLRQYVYEADKIECAITAKEYVDAGYRTQKWIDHTRPLIKSKEGKALLSAIERADSSAWLFGNAHWNSAKPKR
jgi:putative hydrolase of HD superfamily